MSEMTRGRLIVGMRIESNPLGYPQPEDAGVGLATSLFEVSWLIWKATQVPGNILEIGTYRGATTRALAIAFPHRTIFTVDDPFATLDPGQQHEVLPVQQIGALCVHLPNVVICRPPFNYSGRDIGLAFIDGDHRYNAVKADTDAALKNARCVVWHDVTDESPAWCGVTKMIEDNAIPAVRLSGTLLAYLDIRK